jgi:hypothetical protein
MSLSEADPEVAAIIQDEKVRQWWVMPSTVPPPAAVEHPDL